MPALIAGARRRAEGLRGVPALGDVRGVLQVLAFGANLWSLVALLRGNR